MSVQYARKFIVNTRVYRFASPVLVSKLRNACAPRAKIVHECSDVEDGQEFIGGVVSNNLWPCHLTNRGEKTIHVLIYEAFCLEPDGDEVVDSCIVSMISIKD